MNIFLIEYIYALNAAISLLLHKGEHKFHHKWCILLFWCAPCNLFQKFWCWPKHFSLLRVNIQNWCEEQKYSELLSTLISSPPPTKKERNCLVKIYSQTIVILAAGSGWTLAILPLKKSSQALNSNCPRWP